MNETPPGRDPSRTAPASPGVRIRQYEIVSEIGRGGMGVVFRAHDLELDREVALKGPWRELASEPSARRRFLHEARATSRISHPSIVPIHAAFEEDGAPWIVLAFVDGLDLGRIIEKAGPRDGRTVVEVIRWAVQLAEGLEAAHDERILHRDVTPRNILVDHRSRAQLTDFGLARSFPIDSMGTTPPLGLSSISSEGLIIGTPRYMSPEQVLGQELDGRSDLFSLGVVLYEATTGTPAFPTGQLGEVFNAITSREPAPLRRFSYEIPEEWERILLKCLRKSRDDRYPDSRGLLVDLRALHRDLELRAYSTSDSRAPEPVGRRWPRLIWLLLAAVATTLLVVWIVASTRSARQSSPIPAGSAIRVTAGEAWDRDPSLSPDGTRIAFASDRGGDADIYVVDAQGGEPLRLTGSDALESYPCWDPSGRFILYAANRGDGTSIWKVGQMGGSPTLVLEDATDPAMSPDGAQLAFARPSPDGVHRIGVASLTDPSDVRILTEREHGQFWHHDPSWSPDGTKIVYAGIDDLWIVPVTGGEPERLTTRGLGDSDPVFHPDGRHVVFSSRRGGAPGLWSVAEGREPERLAFGSGQEHPTFSKDGKRFAYASQSGTFAIVLHDLRTGVETRVPGAQDDLMPTFAPDGSAVVFASSRWGTTRDLWKQPLRDGRPEGVARRLTELPGQASHPTYSPDGSWIAFYRILDDERDIWVVASDGGIPRRLTDDPGSDTQPAWSRDGKSLVWVSERSGSSQVWTLPIEDGRSGGEPSQLTELPYDPRGPSCSADGRRVVFVGTGEGDGEAWCFAPEQSVPRRITQGANAQRARYDAAGRLWVTGSWGTDRLQCRTVDEVTGLPSDEVIVLGSMEDPPMIDVLVEPPLLAFSRNAPRGSIWMIDGRAGLPSSTKARRRE